MAELSDVQNNENELVQSEVAPAEIPQPEAEVPEKPEKPEKPLSLRDQIKSATTAVRKEEAERARDVASGKFVAKDKAEPPTAAKEIPAPVKDAPPEASKAVGPPPGWSPESKAYFNSLPADHPLRRDVAKREEEVSNGFKKYSDENKRYQEIEQVLAPVRQTYQQVGIQSDAEAIKRLFMWEGMIRQNPAYALQQLAQQYGVNLSPAQSSDQPSAAIQENPYIGQLAQEVQSLKSTIQQSEQQQVSKELSAFAKDKPHFEKVRVSMGRLMQSGMAPDLDSAYQQAIWLDPDIRKQMQDDAEAKQKAELAKANAQVQNAQRAKAAVSPPSRAPNPPPPLQGAKGQKGVRGAILESIAQLNEDRA
jgi:hypothetical protein